MSLRSGLKNIFDRIVYRYSWINRMLRNINKALASATSFRLRPYGNLRVSLSSGIRFKMATNETSSVTKLLFWKGADNYEYTRIFEPLIARCTAFIDIGSNTGYYSLLAASANQGIKIYAIEPASAPLHFLNKSISLNKLESRIKSFGVAFSDEHGQIEFFELDNPEKYHTHYNLAGTGTLRKEDLQKNKFTTKVVPTETLDDFVHREGIQKVDLIKLDTEGTEDRILKGAHDVLQSHKPIIICETLFNTIESKLEKIMLAYGYEFYNHKAGKLYKTESLVREEDNGVRDCFFVHPSKVGWIKEFIGS